jgi:hypothetical protein
MQPELKTCTPTPGDPTGYQAVFVLFTIVRALEFSGARVQTAQ